MGQCSGKYGVIELGQGRGGYIKEKESSPTQDNGGDGHFHYTPPTSPLPSARPLPQFHSPQPSPLGPPSPLGLLSPLGPPKQSPIVDGTPTPHRLFRRRKLFPPPSPAKHIRAALRRHKEADPTQQEADFKCFGYSRNFLDKYELGQEVGRGHFGQTFVATVKNNSMKGWSVAAKIIPKDKMESPTLIEDVKREVKILKALSGHWNVVHFYDACEDEHNVYIVMELCEGGELLERIISRGGSYSEEDAKAIVIQILSIVSYCHLQGIVHRDLKPENFLFSTMDERSTIKAIDFGLSDFIKPDERLHDVVGSAYYVAPEVLQRWYGSEVDVWSVGVIAYILLCGSRPFWGRTETGIFRSVLRDDPSFDEAPWPSLSPQAINFVKRLLHKDPRKRITAAQALAHPWLCTKEKIPLDIFVYRMVKSYLRSSLLKQTALKALSMNISNNDLVYLRAQFTLLEPTKDGCVSLENFKMALVRNATEVMKEAGVMEILKSSINSLAYKKMDFKEFCAAAISVHQLEEHENWEHHSRTAYANFDRQSNRVVAINELAREVNLSPGAPAHIVLHDWVRATDGKLSFTGFVKLLQSVTMHTAPTKRMR